MARSLRRFTTVLVAGAVMAAMLAAVPAGASTAVPAHDPTTVLVGFTADATDEQRAAVHAGQGAALAGRVAGLALDVVRLAPGDDPVAAAARYEALAGVEYAHPNWQVRLLSTPNDPLFGNQYGFHNTGQPVTGSFVRGTADADIDAPEGWDNAFGAGSFPSSGGVRVGVLDTGIDLSHVDLLGKTRTCANAITATGTVVNGSCSDDNLHGTHVAGTVGAISGNGLGVAGTAPNAEFAIFKGLDAAGTGFYADIVAGVDWLADPARGGARIISMSIGGPKDDALDRALSRAYANGVLLVAAAGNDGDSTQNYPAYHPDVISVAATDARDQRASFSNCNSDVELAAPGKDIWSTAPGNSYVSISGTSMATPHVSGVAAMIMSADGLDARQTRSQLANTSDDLGSGGRDTCFGFGRVNLSRALGASSSPTGSTTTEPGAIAGLVTTGTGKNATALSGATVDCGSAGVATTAADGRYRLSEVPAGSHTCTASASGYRSKTSSVTVSSAQTAPLDFNLR